MYHNRKENLNNEKNLCKATCLALAICFLISFMPTCKAYALATEHNTFTAKNSSLKPINLQVTATTYENACNENDVPAEVRARVEEILTEYPNASVSITDANHSSSSSSTYSSSSAWSSARTYNGYTLKDWVVTTNNAFNMEKIISGSSAGDFAGTLLITAAGVILDSQIPFARDRKSVV